jgi:BirA family biotin operon repressor/biotin-[acetyl-CoA-carboxylase] ligase
MGFELAPTADLDGYRLEAHDTVGSTNALALERACARDPGRLWIVSKRQESGRGRRGRAWESPHRNLAATLLLTGAGELRLAATLGFVAGLALSDALAAVVPQGKIGIGVDGGGCGANRFELKWPNDVLANGAKLAGILLESSLLAGGGYALAIGIGVNVVAHPEGLPYPATSLAAVGSNADAETLFVALSDAWTVNARDWNDGRGLGLIRNRWLARAAGLGSDVAVRVDGNIVRGVFETIDEDCRFVVRARDGELVRIAAGDVHFGAVASAGAA